MDFSNPPAAQESSHNVIITSRGKEQYSFVSHLSAALRREGISSSVITRLPVTSQPINVVFYPRGYLFPSSMFIKARCIKIIEVIKPRRDNSIGEEDSYYADHLYDGVFYKSTLTRTLTRIPDSRIFTLEILEEIPNSRSLTECELLEEIVKDIYEYLYSAARVGIYSKLLEIENLIYKQQRDVRSLGIWGMPGIGKTTLATAVFKHMSTDYDASCFIENFDEAFHKQGLHHLLEEKIGKILNEEFDIKSSYILRPSLLRDKLCDKRILIVLDDVRDSLAAESFLGRLDWFGPTSVIVMTSVDKQVFAFCHINHIYELQGLNKDEALRLFSQKAFGKNWPEENDREISRKVIDYANGNPLALSIYGRELMGKKSEMEVAFLKLKQCPPKKIHDMLKNVYSALDDNEKNIVLDIASFFKGENVNYVVQMLEGCRYLPRIGINGLVDKCVLTISENTLQMNNLIQDICQEIFNGEIESCIRMSAPYIIRYLLEDSEPKACEESSATPKYGLVVEDIESIILDTSNLKFDVKPDAFKNMHNLKFLKIYSSCSKYVLGLKFPKGLDSLPCGLRLLHWENYPLQYLPQDFDLDNLVELCMPYSQLQTLKIGTKNLKMLRRIILCHSQQLVGFDIPLKAQNIELIDLQECTRLRNFPDTSQLQHLRVVNLSGCTEFTSFQGAPPNIEELHLQGTNITEVPISIVSHSPQKVKLDRQKLLNLLENFQDVEHIDLDSVTDLVKVSSYNQGFGKLVHLNMKDCSHLKSLPDMVSLESLQVLHLSGCSELKEIKGFPRNMIKLYIGGTAIREVPQLPKSLELLNAHGCTYLKSVSLKFEKLPRHYIFSNCFNFSSQVIAEFLENGLPRVASLARAQQQEVIICIPADARQRSSFLLQGGPHVMVDLAPWTQNPLSGFAMSVVVSFQDDYHNTVGLGIRCRCKWEVRFEERIFQCWAPREAPKVEWDHIFILYDTQMQPSGSEVHFEFETVSWENELLGESCKVTQCGVQIITAPTFDTIASEIIGESEATSINMEEHPPTSSRVLEARIPNPLSTREPLNVSSARNKLRSTGTMFWKWLQTIRRNKKKKTLTNREPVDLTTQQSTVRL